MRAGTTILIAALAVLIIIMGFGVMSGEAGLSNVAIIPINGVIVSQGSDGLFGSTSTSSSDVVRWIENADESSSIKIILLEINSPGGSAVASDEIARAVEKTNKPVISWIREAGASGAYWVASESDHIIANRMSITGSVGVISSYLDFSEFIDEHNVTYQRLVAGKYKDTGNPFAELSEEQKTLLQKKLDLIHDLFLDDVVQNRNLTEEQRNEIQTGMYFLGIEAIELGLVDELGGRDEVKAWLEEQLDDEPRYILYEPERGLFDNLFNVRVGIEPTNNPLIRS